jgi:hypothetical protein
MWRAAEAGHPCYPGFPFRPGFPLCQFGRGRLYTQSLPWEPFLLFCPSRATPAAQEPSREYFARCAVCPTGRYMSMNVDPPLRNGTAHHAPPRRKILESHKLQTLMASPNRCRPRNTVSYRWRAVSANTLRINHLSSGTYQDVPSAHLLRGRAAGGQNPARQAQRLPDVVQWRSRSARDRFQDADGAHVARKAIELLP